MNDTPAQIEKRYRDMILSLSPAERLRMASRMYDSGTKLVISGIKNSNSQLTASQMCRQFFLRMYGDDFTAAERERIINKMSNMQFDADR